ncbi:hypothetical protein YC2023_017617 [Brassica napus]
MVSIIWSSVAGKPTLPKRGLMYHQRYHLHLAMLFCGQAKSSALLGLKSNIIQAYIAIRVYSSNMTITGRYIQYMNYKNKNNLPLLTP